jgi:hypothetical protein
MRKTLIALSLSALTASALFADISIGIDLKNASSKWSQSVNSNTYNNIKLPVKTSLAGTPNLSVMSLFNGINSASVEGGKCVSGTCDMFNENTDGTVSLKGNHGYLIKSADTAFNFNLVFGVDSSLLSSNCPTANTCDYTGYVTSSACESDKTASYNAGVTAGAASCVSSSSTGGSCDAETVCTADAGYMKISECNSASSTSSTSSSTGGTSTSSTSSSTGGTTSTTSSSTSSSGGTSACTTEETTFGDVYKVNGSEVTKAEYDAQCTANSSSSSTGGTTSSSGGTSADCTTDSTPFGDVYKVNGSEVTKTEYDAQCAQ